MRAFSRAERGVFAAFRSLTAPRASSAVAMPPSADQDSDPAQSSISSDDARGSLSPEEGSRGDTLLPMLVGALVLIVLGIGAVFLVV
jgi:hypothetical protein